MHLTLYRKGLYWTLLSGLLLILAASSTYTPFPPSAASNITDGTRQNVFAALSVSAQRASTIPVGSLFYTYEGHTSMVFGVAWSPDARRIASASLDGTVQVWDSATGKHVLIYRKHAGPVFTVRW